MPSVSKFLQPKFCFSGPSLLWNMFYCSYVSLFCRMYSVISSCSPNFTLSSLIDCAVCVLCDSFVKRSYVASVSALDRLTQLYHFFIVVSFLWFLRSSRMLYQRYLKKKKKALRRCCFKEYVKKKNHVLIAFI